MTHWIPRRLFSGKRLRAAAEVAENLGGLPRNREKRFRLGDFRPAPVADVNVIEGHAQLGNPE